MIDQTRDPQRYFTGDDARKRLAHQLYKEERDTPLICPHGHVDPRLFASESYDWGTPVDMFIIPDHYVFRMLYSQGIPLESLGIPRTDSEPVENDHRKIWQTFADHWHLFNGTPTGLWLREEWREVFGIERKLTGDNAQTFYDELSEKLQQPDFQPRALYDRFNIETLCTTDYATDTLEHHRTIRESNWHGDVRPTFRPDDVIQVDRNDWRDNVARLGELTDIAITDYRSYLDAIEKRRADFRALGAVATDHDVFKPHMDDPDADTRRTLTRLIDNERITRDGSSPQARLLMILAEMSVTDGLVMQLHVGSSRNHNQPLYEQFGRDVGADIPVQMQFTSPLKPLLSAYGNNTDFRCIVFTLDESTYSRELAPLAGHYPALRLGPPWWFHDSPNGMRRYFDRVMETAGIYNTAGFNDDTRAFCSIPVRHDLWRRMSANWLAGLVMRGIIDEADAAVMMREMAYGLAKRAYRLDESATQ